MDFDAKRIKAGINLTQQKYYLVAAEPLGELSILRKGSKEGCENSCVSVLLYNKHLEGLGFNVSTTILYVLKMKDLIARFGVFNVDIACARFEGKTDG